MCSMRWTSFFALAALLPMVAAHGQSETETAPPKPVKTPTSLPRAKAEPENGQAYGAPVASERAGPSEADVGPAQKHFVRASTTDNLEALELTPDGDNAWDNAAQTIPEKIALDKHISVRLVHDVQNDGPRSSSENHALDFEVTYLNWGAVTQEQLLARRGHYFTITWKNSGPKDDFTTRFEYREVRSKEIVRTLTQNLSGVSGAVRSYFAVVDQAYLAYGPVVSWRFSVLKGDTIVAQTRSFIW
jgi:hypothetical protein